MANLLWLTSMASISSVKGLPQGIMLRSPPSWRPPAAVPVWNRSTMDTPQEAAGPATTDTSNWMSSVTPVTTPHTSQEGVCHITGCGRLFAQKSRSHHAFSGFRAVHMLQIRWTQRVYLFIHVWHGSSAKQFSPGHSLGSPMKRTQKAPGSPTASGALRGGSLMSVPPSTAALDPFNQEACMQIVIKLHTHCVNTGLVRGLAAHTAWVPWLRP